ncbi:MAG TPA: hypothetical protein VF389_05255, partial [Woeseiaceae bacterium]
RMNIRKKKAQADQLLREAEEQRLSRNRHVARALDIARQRIGSPVGLAVCFGAGALTGYGARRKAEQSYEQSSEPQNGWIRRAMDGPVGDIAVRLATASLINALMNSLGPGEGTADEAAGLDIA